MAGNELSFKTEVLAACVTHYKDILFHATAADKARTPLTTLISTLSGIDIVTEGFEAQGLVILPQQKRRPLEAFVIAHVANTPLSVDLNGHIISFEMPRNVGRLRTEPPHKTPKLLEAAEVLFSKALAAPAPLDALAAQIEKSGGNALLAKNLRHIAAYIA
jgi:hypothetical protein